MSLEKIDGLDLEDLTFGTTWLALLSSGRLSDGRAPSPLEMVDKFAQLFSETKDEDEPTFSPSIFFFLLRDDEARVSFTGEIASAGVTLVFVSFLATSVGWNVQYVQDLVALERMDEPLRYLEDIKMSSQQSGLHGYLSTTIETPEVPDNVDSNRLKTRATLLDTWKPLIDEVSFHTANGAPASVESQSFAPLLRGTRESWATLPHDTLVIISIFKRAAPELLPFVLHPVEYRNHWCQAAKENLYNGLVRISMFEAMMQEVKNNAYTQIPYLTTWNENSDFHALRLLSLTEYVFANLIPPFLSTSKLEVLTLREIKGDETGLQTTAKGMLRPVFSLRELFVSFMELIGTEWSWLLHSSTMTQIEQFTWGETPNQIISLAEVVGKPVKRLHLDLFLDEHPWEWPGGDVANALSNFNSITHFKFSGNDKLWKRILNMIASPSLKTTDFRFTARGCKDMEVALLDT
ncbi:hypothetical protein M422DRAFT_256625 [Sphaerobolus stellatus SS14]|uniref:Uncharacterized protein n=1 Tax=Sphaerobolus stellatus (strain SS14) TaxID=990650 RepID=A0A0C9VG64_SPHS4|nr:hypothetical protein M422DRAFT_256625 [Sphaerobolus stellatus SS14]